MKHLLNKQRKIITLLICALWIPIIFLCTNTLISERSNSAFLYFFLALILFFILFGIGQISKCLQHTSFTEQGYPIRIARQFLYGFVLPLIPILILIMLYHQFFDNKAVHLVKELSIVSIYMYGLNTFYLVLYTCRDFYITTFTIEEEQQYHERLVVYHQGTYSPINLVEIALIDQRSQINWLVTFNAEEHILNLSLKETQSILNANQFFKINRSQIVSKAAIRKFRAGSYGKIILILNVNGIKCTVSKDRAKDFRRWFHI